MSIRLKSLLVEDFRSIRGTQRLSLDARYPAGTWIRSPHLSEHTPFSVEGCLIYVKTGHLPT